MGSYFRLDITAGTVDEAERLMGILTLHASYGWEEEDVANGRTCFHVSSENKSYILNARDAVQQIMPELACELLELQGRDWLAAWREFFSPVECGTRFVVLPPWLAGEYDFSNRTPIIIEPKSAFGTGHHATTSLCLRALSELLDAGRARPGQTFLDLGTGTGILAIACAKSGLSGLALDIDPLAVDNALENKKLNGAENFEALEGGMERAADRIYDMILANILANPLVELAPMLFGVLADGGCLILSGILAEQADRVEAVYRAQGLPRARRLYDGEWVALIWGWDPAEPGI